MKLQHYVFVGVLAVSVVGLNAQPTPSSPPPDPTTPSADEKAPAADEKNRTTEKDKESDIVLLNPFQVNGKDDLGYTAGTAISATRINTPLNELPFTISAITPQFIADIGATSLLEIVSQQAGVKSGVSNNTQGNASFSVRGFVQAPQRDGFSANQLANNYVAEAIIERVEVVKGPASLLYGAIAPGGTVNYITKYAEPKPFDEVHLGIGSYNYTVATLDTNHPLIKDKLLFRFVASYENGEQYFANTKGHNSTVYPALKWIITPHATLSFTYSDYHSREQPPAVYLPNTDLATPASIVNALYGAGHPAGGSLLANKTGPAVALGVSDVSDPGFMGPTPVMPKNFNISDIHDTRINDLKALNAELNVKVGDHWDGRAHIGSDKDYMTFAETGHATLFIPPPDSLVYSGGVWSVSPSWLAMTPAQQIAAGLAYAQAAVNNLSLLNSTQNGTPTPQLIDRAPRVQEQWLQATTYQAEMVGQFNFPTWKLQLLGGLFYDDVRFNLRTTQNRGNAASPFFRDWDVNPASPSYYVNFDEGQFTGNTLSVVNTYTTTYNSDFAAYGLVNVSMFQDRLITVAGMRYNESESQVYDHNAGAYSPGLRAKHPTPQLGIGFKFNQDFMVYASYSESYTLSTQPYLTVLGTVNGIPTAIPTTPTEPTIGKGVEAGFKFSVPKEKLNVTCAVYEIKQENVLQPLNQNINGTGVVIWNQGAEQRGRGVEATFDWTPVRNFQLLVNVSEEDVRNIKEPVGLDYYLGQNVGYTAKTMANMWGRYDFTCDSLKGLWIGAGFNYVGKNAGDPRNVSYYLPAYTLWNSALGVDWKWNGHHITTTVNFKNMGDTQYKPSPNSVGAPRRFLLTTALRF